MLQTILIALVSGLMAPLVHRWSAKRSGLILALVPLLLFGYFFLQLEQVAAGQVVLQQFAWAPSLGLHLAFRLDGLSLLFALLICGIGSTVFLYASGYLAGHKDLGRFYLILSLFMTSMLGLVLADNLLAMFVFWELTSVTSYLLIGFNHSDANARKLALQGFLVTVAGGLALMCGIILLGIMGGTYSLTELLANPETLQQHPLLLVTMICLMIGAFTKSAQFPFHFWLPNAMAAPTPVSAYLHSATMVKAGIYLLARLNPAFADNAFWSNSLLLFGSITMLLGAYLSYSATGIKRVLAYSTLMALGMLVMLLGLQSDYAYLAFVTLLLAHSLYKGALFMLAGALDHATGTKDLTLMGGLRSCMPMTALIALIAGLSAAGLPPLFGFVAKEMVIAATLDGPILMGSLLLVLLATAALTVAAIGSVALLPFYGKRKQTPRQAHECGAAFLAGPSLLAALSLLFGLWPALADDWLLGAAAAQIQGQPVWAYLALWHGFNWPLALSAFSLLLGIVLLLVWQRSRVRLHGFNQFFAAIGPEATYFALLNGMTALARWQTRVLQNGVMGIYLLVMVLTTVALVGYTLLTQLGLPSVGPLLDFSFYELSILLMMLLTSLYLVRTPSRLGAVASLGVLGFMLALLFIHFSAPDLGITQVLVETLTVILLVLVLFRLPGFKSYSSRFERQRDALAAISFGLLMTLLTLTAMEIQIAPSISDWMVQASYPQAKGKNLVNVILVDFRALDTLGEIFVLAIAALGVFSMLRLQAKETKNAP